MKKIFLVLLLLLNIPSVCLAAAATMYVTTTGAGNKDGTDWANAFSATEWEADLEGNAEAGDVYYVEGGTYTLSSSIDASAKSGTAVAPIRMIGVAPGTTAEPPTFSDWAFSTDRPLIAAGAQLFYFGLYWEAYNFDVTTTSSLGFRINQGKYENCKVYNSSASAYPAYGVNGYGSTVIRCQGRSDNQHAFHLTDAWQKAISCYAHDSTNGFMYSGSGISVEHSVVDTCTTGVDFSSNLYPKLINNTFYNCTTGLSGGTASLANVISNIFDECSTPATWGTEQKSNTFDYNSWDGDASSNVKITEGNNSIDSDISLTDPANGDFTLPSGAGALDAGLQVDTNVGVTGDYKWNIGADQDDVGTQIYDSVIYDSTIY